MVKLQTAAAYVSLNGTGGYVPKIFKTPALNRPSPDTIDLLETIETWLSHKDNHNQIVGRLLYRKIYEILESNRTNLEARLISLREIIPARPKTQNDAKAYIRLVNRAFGNYFIITT